MRVGLFDSGMGGLTVAKSLLEKRLFETIIYYGDTARVPYGTKEPQTIIDYAFEALEFFSTFHLDMIIIACNTVSAHAITVLKERSSIPIVGVIEPGILACMQQVKNTQSHILILGTHSTIGSKRYERLLQQHGYTNLTSIATTLLVSLVEESIFEGELLNHTLEHYLSHIGSVDAIILGCTHFPLIEKSISDYFSGVPTIHSGDAIVEYLQDHYRCTDVFENPHIEFFASENPRHLQCRAQQWLGRDYDSRR